MQNRFCCKHVRNHRDALVKKRLYHPYTYSTKHLPMSNHMSTSASQPTKEWGGGGGKKEGGPCNESGVAGQLIT